MHGIIHTTDKTMRSANMVQGDKHQQGLEECQLHRPYICSACRICKGRCAYDLEPSGGAMARQLCE